ncbi:MAG TPA: tRNA (adenosine(37)-N6)-threonylcarbamoyltransferase complex ATPase subunit type 1 TsaE [Steroidobacteraceae bacterium]
MKRDWPLRTAADTERLGAALGLACPWEPSGPRLLFLSGELGAGKTTLAAALLEALGAGETVRSPSYALIETYELHAGLAVHLDCYRLRESRELEQLGLRDYFTARTLWLVEWPERGGAALPAPDLALLLEVATEGRLARLEARSAVGETWLSDLK